MSVRGRICAILAVLCAVCLTGQYLSGQTESGGLTRLRSGKSFEEILPDLYEKNSDLAGWIRIRETPVSYPVMRSEQYLQRDFAKKISRCGTPFVKESWDREDRVSMIYGHNMWEENTMFHPLHRYEEAKYLEEHPEIEFYVLDMEQSVPRVEHRHYRIHAVAKVSVRDDLYIAAENAGRNSAGDAAELFDAADSQALYGTGVKQGGDELILCTCSYHIPGKRDEGRLLIFATRCAPAGK